MSHFEIIKDNSKEIIDQINKGMIAGLEACGQFAESRAIENLERAGRAGGALGQSIEHTVASNGDSYTAWIGSNTEYAPYVEFGTGAYYPSGRKTPWVYQDDAGNWHTTIGMEASPYLKPAITDHQDKYPKMIADGIAGNL